MKVEVIRKYTIDYEGSAEDFIILVDRFMNKDEGGGLDSLDMGDASYAATELYDQGDLTNIVEETDHNIIYIKCEDKSTRLEADPDHPGTLRRVKYTNERDYHIVHPAAVEAATIDGNFHRIRYADAMKTHYGY